MLSILIAAAEPCDCRPRPGAADHGFGTSTSSSRLTPERLQEDVFVPTLCALETVQFAAQLRLPGSATAGYRSTRVKQVMKVMGLWRSRNTQVRMCTRIPAST